MKILFLTEFFPIRNAGEISGGAESRTYYLAKSLAKKSYKVMVVTALVPNSNSEENWDGIEIYRVGNPYDYTQTGKFLNRLLFFIAAVLTGLHLDADLVDANSVPTYIAAWIIGTIKSVKTVFWIPDVVGIRNAVKHFGFVTGFIEGFYELVSIYFFRGSATIALSETTRNKLLEFKYDKGKTVVIYPGV